MTREESGPKPSSTGPGEAGKTPKPGEQAREGFWGKGHQGSGFHRAEGRAHSREDYGRAGYDESGRKADDDSADDATDRGRPPG